MINVVQAPQVSKFVPTLHVILAGGDGEKTFAAWTAYTDWVGFILLHQNTLSVIGRRPWTRRF